MLVRKLKPDQNYTVPFVFLSMLPIFGLTTLIFGLPVGLIVLTVIVWLFGLYYLVAFLRTLNLPQLFLFIYALYLGGIFLLLRQNILVNSMPGKDVEIAFLMSLVFFGGVLFYLALTRRLKWRGREVFELAAESIEEIGDGYTHRPRPVGKVTFSPQQIQAFSRFCARHLIALPYVAGQNTTLVPIKMGDEFSRLLGLSGDYRNATWVNFDQNGEVSVHIAQKDYLDYRESLAFDPLCASLGQLFIDFCEQVNKGEGVRIIDRMNDLRIPVLS
jgi:hypothetical protein